MTPENFRLQLHKLVASAYERDAATAFDLLEEIADAYEIASDEAETLRARAEAEQLPHARARPHWVRMDNPQYRRPEPKK